MRLNKLQNSYSVYEKKLNFLTNENKKLTEKIAISDTDFFWKLEAKRKLGYIQPNEHVFKFY